MNSDVNKLMDQIYKAAGVPPDLLSGGNQTLITGSSAKLKIIISLMTDMKTLWERRVLSESGEKAINTKENIDKLQDLINKARNKLGDIFLEEAEKYIK